jgi:hypothetical protein
MRCDAEAPEASGLLLQRLASPATRRLRPGNSGTVPFRSKGREAVADLKKPAFTSREKLTSLTKLYFKWRTNYRLSTRINVMQGSVGKLSDEFSRRILAPLAVATILEKVWRDAAGLQHGGSRTGPSRLWIAVGTVRLTIQAGYSRGRLTGMFARTAPDSITCP